MWARVSVSGPLLSPSAGCDVPAVLLLQMERHLAGANVFSGWEAVGHRGQGQAAFLGER